MRRFFHRKGQASRPGIPTANGGLPSNRSPAGLLPGAQGPTPTTGRVRAPALRSRSMSVLSGPESQSGRPKKFTRSLSFCDDQQTVAVNPNSSRKLLTQTEEDEVFQMYTKKLYLMFASLCAVIVGIAVYAYIYNTAGKGT